MGGKVRASLPPLAVESLEHWRVLRGRNSNRDPLVVIAIEIAHFLGNIFEVGSAIVVAWRCFHNLAYVLIEATVVQVHRELFANPIKR